MQKTILMSYMRHFILRQALIQRMTKVINLDGYSLDILVKTLICSKRYSCDFIVFLEKYNKSDIPHTCWI